MVIRKPYAILIKNFKLIHAMLFIIMAYLSYKTGMISKFFADYFANGENVMGQEITNGLFNNLMYFLIVLILLGLITVLVLMVTKKKPIKYYIISIITYIAIIVVINIDHSILTQMEGEQFSARTVRALSDVTNIAVAIQIAIAALTFIRATGFNIKQFDFEKDLQELNITEEDREEVEVGLDLDSDKFKRRIRKQIRHIKYAYLENKLISNIIIVVLVGLLGYTIYTKSGINEKKYKQGDYFYTSNFVMNIENSYITNTNYKLEKLDKGKTLVILQIKIRNQYTIPVKFETARAELRVGDSSYYPTKQYLHDMIDFGNVYDNKKITSKEDTYILCYVVPSNYLDKKMSFKYIDSIEGNKKKKKVTYVNVKVSPSNLIGEKINKEYKLGDTIDFKDSPLNGITLKINSFDVKNEYKLSYNFCPTSGECYQSYEYIKPDILSNYDKVLLKLNYNHKNENKYIDEKYNNAFYLARDYMKVKYTLNGKEKYNIIKLQTVNPNKLKLQNEIYLEVLGEISRADKISLEFNVKNIKYIYKLK